MTTSAATAVTVMAFSLAAFEAVDSAVLTLQNARDDDVLAFNGEPVTIELYGPGSEQYAKAQAKIDAGQQARTFAALRGKAPKDAADEARRLQIEKYVACTKTLTNFPIEGGAKALYENRKLGYITAQVHKFMEDWANFPPSSSAS